MTVNAPWAGRTAAVGLGLLTFCLRCTLASGAKCINIVRVMREIIS